jgi:hypothetical protein
MIEFTISAELLMIICKAVISSLIIALLILLGLIGYHAYTSPSETRFGRAVILIIMFCVYLIGAMFVILTSDMMSFVIV